MKNYYTLLISFFIALFPPNTFAFSKSCLVKQKNAAAYVFAQAAPIAVQEVEIVRIKRGKWTTNDSNNIGSDEITVFGNRPFRGPTEATYKVTAKQIGNFDTCEILTIE